MRIAVDQFCAEVAEARRVGFFMTSGLVDDFADCLAVPVRDRAAKERDRWEQALKESGERLTFRLISE